MLMYCRELLTQLERSFLKYISFRRMQRTKQGGFTLVELMVVVAVIAILAAIAMPQFMSAADKAKNAKQVADMQIIRNAPIHKKGPKGIYRLPVLRILYKLAR
jgi:prepilin-type N-terminal cleavage/methylation domain-containing protein